VYAVSESGFYVIPTMICPKKSMKESLKYGAALGTVFRSQDKGWMETLLHLS
jgi:hypothetical protein